jgi:DNA-binding transcriptional MerR regulator
MKEPVPPREYSLGELAELSGVPARTIRYYITRGVLGGPAKGGRGAFYTHEHLRRLERIRQQQERGRTLAEIEFQIKGQPAADLNPEPWWMFQVSSDVMVQVRGGSSSWRMHRIRTAVERLVAELAEEPEGKEESK